MESVPGDADMAEAHCPCQGRLPVDIPCVDDV